MQGFLVTSMVFFLALVHWSIKDDFNENMIDLANVVRSVIQHIRP